MLVIKVPHRIDEKLTTIFSASVMPDHHWPFANHQPGSRAILRDYHLPRLWFGCSHWREPRKRAIGLNEHGIDAECTLGRLGDFRSACKEGAPIRSGAARSQRIGI